LELVWRIILEISGKPVFVSFEGDESFFVRNGNVSIPKNRQEQSEYEKLHWNNKYMEQQYNQKIENMNRYDYEKRRALLWQKFAGIYNARIRNLQAQDDLISNAIRKVLNMSGNIFFEMKQEVGAIPNDIPEKKRVDTIMSYQVCMGAGYWLQITERIMDKRNLPTIDSFSDQQIIDGFPEWERKGIELYNTFSDFLSKHGENSDILPNEIVNCMIWAVLHIKAGDYSDIPVQIGNSTKIDRKNINGDFLRLMTWGYLLGRVEENLYSSKQNSILGLLQRLNFGWKEFLKQIGLG